jgi:hypothetical protein
MAKVIQLRNESWLIDWIIDTTGKIEGKTSFQIANRQSTFVLKCNYRFLQLTLSMSALDAGEHILIFLAQSFGRRIIEIKGLLHTQRPSRGCMTNDFHGNQFARVGI